MKIALQMLGSVVFGMLFFGLSLFIPAGTVNYWQAWVFMGVFMIATMGPTSYLMINDPAALARRMQAGPTAETRPAQRIIITAIIASVIATLVISALDHRFGWSSVPLWLIVVGNILVFTGLTMAQLVIVQNSYAGASITVERDQPLVTTGLYGVVRHPMYSGTLVMMIGLPPALDSLWGLVAIVASLPTLMARVLDEEKMLCAELPGYRDYQTAVRYRLVPGVW